MSELNVQVLIALLALGSIPPTCILLSGLIKDLKRNSHTVRTTVAPVIFLLGCLLIASMVSIGTSAFFLMGHQEIALHYDQLRTLFVTSTWFAVVWALYLVHSLNKR